MFYRIIMLRALFVGFLVGQMLVGFVQAQVLTVGPAAPCQFADLQSAINNTNASISEIHVAVDYLGPPITFSNKTLRIYGGYSSCDPGATQVPFDQNASTYTTLNGALNSSRRGVIEINGQVSLDLRNFFVINGHNSGSEGGGIRFFSSGNFGHLELHSVLVKNNTADRGGGIFFKGNTSADDLVLEENTFIDFNLANHAGGGIRLEGHAHLHADQLNTVIANNTANPNDTNDGRGGGLQLLDASTAEISTPGTLLGLGVISGNHARIGGGIDVQDISSLTLATRFVNTSVRIENNDASLKGGGIYLTPNSGVGGGEVPFFCAWSFAIKGNRAPTGSAIFADFSDFLGTGIDLGCSRPASSVQRNLITGNMASQSGGAAIVVSGGDVGNAASLSINQVEFRTNLGDYVVRIDGSSLDDSYVIQNSLFAENTGVGVLYSSSPQQVELAASTVVGNNLTGQYVFESTSGNLVIDRSIVWQPNRNTLPHGHGAPTQKAILSDLIAADADALNGDAMLFNAFHAVTGSDPQFFAPEQGDFHLRSASPGVDYTSDGAGLSPDLDGNPRGVSLLRVGTPFDIGAYELQLLIPITFPSNENFDELGDGSKLPSLPFGWTTSHFGSGSGWFVTNGGASSGPYAAHVDQPASSSGGANDNMLDTPAFFVVQNAGLAFRHKFAFLPATGAAAILQIKIGSTGSFEDIETAGGHFVSGGYNDVLPFSIPANPIGPTGTRVWTNVGNTSYGNVVVNLPSAADNQLVQLRWRVAGADLTSGGYSLDDIQLNLKRLPDIIFRNSFE